MYWDALLFINFLVNSGLLLAVARLGHRHASVIKILAGALAGALPVPAVVGGGNIIWWLLLFLLPFMMVSIAFFPLNFRDIVYTGGTLFLCALIAGGLMTALLTLTGSFMPRAGFGLWSCLLLTAFIFSAGIWFWHPYINEKKWDKLLGAKVVVSFGDRRGVLDAYLDTGNKVRDPFLRKPVLITGYDSMRDVFPGYLLNLVKDSDYNAVNIMESLGDTSVAERFYLIPFSGVNGNTELLLGFKPDSLIIMQGNKTFEAASLMSVGVYKESPHVSGNRQALMPYEVLDMVN